MSKKKETDPEAIPATDPGGGSAGLMGNAGAGPFAFGPGSLAQDPEPPAPAPLHSRDPQEADRANAQSLPLFRVRFDLSSPIGTPEAVYRAEDEAAAIAAHRRFNGLGSTMSGTITCHRVD